MREITKVHKLYESKNVAGDFDTKATPQDCADYREMTVFLDVQSVTGTLNISVYSLMDGKWHLIGSFSAITSAGTYHLNCSNFGCKYALVGNANTAAKITASVVLKV